MNEDVQKLKEQAAAMMAKRRNVKKILWSLVAALGFLIVISFFASIGGNDKNKNPNETPQNGNEDSLPIIPSEEVFYVDFLSLSGNEVYLANLNGSVNGEEIEIYVTYNFVDQEILCYRDVAGQDTTKLLVSYACKLEHGQSYEIAVEEQHGMLFIKKGDNVLCSVALTPGNVCEWSSITPELREDPNEDPEETQSETSSEVETEESSSQEELEGSSESISKPDDTKEKGSFNIMGFLTDVILAALLSAVLAIVAVVGLIAWKKKDNPIGIIVATAKNYMPQKKERAKRVRTYRADPDEYLDEDDYDDDYDEDDYDEEYEEDDYDEEAYEDSYEDEDTYEDDYDEETPVDDEEE